MSRHVTVIGAGPAGLMVAERLAARGFSVAVHDRMASPARKFLMAGRGGLNLTHSEPLDAFLSRYGAARPRLEPAIRAFPPEALRAWCDGLGGDSFVGSSGRVFPRAMKASPLLRGWLRRLESLGVTLHSGHRWRGWSDAGDLLFDTPDGPLTAPAETTVLALGGASWPRLGSDGGWQAILADAGIAMAPLRPANAGLKLDWPHWFIDRHAGQPLKRIALSFAGAGRRGELMIARDGLEGGAAYAMFAPIREALARGETVRPLLDLRPDLTQAALADRLASGGRLSLPNLLTKKAGLAKPAADLLPALATVPADPAGRAALIKALPLPITGTAGIERAISSAGGIAWNALTDGFMLRDRPGTYAIGEMVDWEAPTGGYLLQACFSMAVAAADAIASRADHG